MTRDGTFLTNTAERERGGERERDRGGEVEGEREGGEREGER